MTPDDRYELADRLFDEWADQRKLSTFSRSPLRRCWWAAFQQGMDHARLDDDDPIEIDQPDSAA